MTQTSDAVNVAVRAVTIMGTGTRADIEAVTHQDMVNREAIDEPPACRGTGPDAVWATALWLRSAFADLHHEPHEVVAEGDLVVIHTTMSGRHTGPFVVYDENASVKHAFAPTGRTFAVTQTHWVRMRDGLCIEHWANRDDMGMGEQLGWVPPTPRYLLKCLRAKREAVRADKVAR
ncbi:ester cyclase [Gordonia insulae]|uniref:Aklanonic acid methyl ester cyclase DnrD n=1 Tax=Gordonia insulae TaxID=2420509 RepID=A0A3G8JKL0_9ACTN|nr:ester cyclase [Gordonia insulae]AZG45072.1 Aklanonic acid methyl ester cyclase DnrD [Gordonia insulae]